MEGRFAAGPARSVLFKQLGTGHHRAGVVVHGNREYGFGAELCFVAGKRSPN